jgi:hypothetical protein
VTEDEFWKDYALIRDDVATARLAFHTSETIERLAADKAILRKLNEAADYWILHRYSLNVTLFIVLGRLFDDGPDAHSIHRLLSTNVRHPELFSKKAIRARKAGAGSAGRNTDIGWLDEAMSRITWEPTKENLGRFKQSLSPFVAKYNDVYRPIRTRVVAHTLLKEYALRAELFSKTHVKELEEILRALHNAVMAIWELAYNGTEPDIAGDYGYDYRVRKIQEQTEMVIRKLTGPPFDGDGPLE